MSRAKPILAGGAAAIVLASATQLFPPFNTVDEIAGITDPAFFEATNAFAAMLNDSDHGLGALDQFGLGTERIETARDTVLISDKSGRCSDQGIYWLRSATATPLALTAPHRGSDRHTGTLAAALFQETDAMAAAWNSAPRKARNDCPHALDLAREKNHLFTAFSLGFAKAAPSGLLVQLHGFEQGRRQDIAARDAAMIVSNGTEEPGNLLLDLADCLSAAFAPQSVLVFPGDTAELGALTNAQGQALRDAGFDGFAHIEMSAELRASMVKDEALRARFGACLKAVTA